MSKKRDRGISRKNANTYGDRNDSLSNGAGGSVPESGTDYEDRRSWEESWEAGHRQARYESENHDTRDRDTAGWDSGHRDTADWDSGHRDTADWDSGHRDTAGWDSGHSGNADRDSGYRDTTGWDSGYSGNHNLDLGHRGDDEAQDEEFKSTQKKQSVKKKKKRRKKRYLLKITIACLAIAAAYYFVNSSFFDVQSIEVENNVYYTSGQIVEKSGLGTGSNIFRINLGELKKRLLEDPYIVTAKAKRVLPSKVIINVSERQEAAFIRDGDYVIIDKEGLVLRRSEVAPLLPELSNINIASAEEGKALDVEQNAAFSDTMRLMNEAAKSELYFKKIDISNIIVRAYVYDHLICEGTPDNLIKNMKPMKSVLEELDQQGIQRGTVKVSGDKYIAWQPAEET